MRVITRMEVFHKYFARMVRGDNLRGRIYYCIYGKYAPAAPLFSAHHPSISKSTADSIQIGFPPVPWAGISRLFYFLGVFQILANRPSEILVKYFHASDHSHGSISRVFRGDGSRVFEMAKDTFQRKSISI